MARLREFVRDGRKYSASRLLLIWLDSAVLIALTLLSVAGYLPFAEVVKLMLGLNATLCTVYAVNTYRRGGSDG